MAHRKHEQHMGKHASRHGNGDRSRGPSARLWGGGDPDTHIHPERGGGGSTSANCWLAADEGKVPVLQG